MPRLIGYWLTTTRARVTPGWPTSTGPRPRRRRPGDNREQATRGNRVLGEHGAHRRPLIRPSAILSPHGGAREEAFASSRFRSPAIARGPGARGRGGSVG